MQTRPSSFDSFFKELEKQLNASPDRRDQIIRNAIKDSQCPYLIGKLREFTSALKALVIVGLWSLSTLAAAQIKVQVLDNQNGKPLIGATVTFQNIASDRSTFEVADKSGWVTSDLNFPVAITVRHLGYRPYSDTLFESNESLLVALDPDASRLDEIVVTGQFEAQAIDESVFTVKSISQQRIEAQGAVDLADVLSNNLNITITPNKSAGRSTINMLGLSGQYVKVLMDGVPFVSVEGNGNNVDITQINLNNIERVEIVEGPMAVSYGANAVAGVINLITKKRPTNNFYIQEETVGSEYGLKQGRHIQNLALGYSISDNLVIQGEYRRNDFRGFKKNYEGDDHLENDGNRGYDWQPKLQNSGSIGISWSPKSHHIRYRTDLFYQTIDRYARQVFPDRHPATGIENPYAFDNRVSTNRFSHNLNFTGHLGQISYNVVSSYSGVEMEDETYRHRLLNDVEEAIINEQHGSLRLP